jgi:DNA helicase-2/ATP-dependent DNA helicase PcrA
MIEAVLLGGYMEYLQERWPDYENRAEDLEQLKNYSARFENLESFLSELALLTNVVGEDAAEGVVDEERLILSTVHQAKGSSGPMSSSSHCARGNSLQARASMTRRERRKKEGFSMWQ